MGRYTVISEITESIINLLREDLVPEPIRKKDLIGACSPGDKADIKIGLHLYDVQENGEFVNRNRIQRASDQVQYPPMSLTLYYMLTAYSNADPRERGIDAQRALGRCIQSLYDKAILTPDMLIGSLSDYNESIEISRHNMTFEEKQRIWHFPNIPYQLSVFYKVAPVYVESTRVKTVKPVSDIEITMKGR